MDKKSKKSILEPISDPFGTRRIDVLVVDQNCKRPSMHHRSHDRGSLHPGGVSPGEGCFHGGLPSGVGSSSGVVCPLWGGGVVRADRHKEIHVILRDMVKKWAVRILLQCIPVI